MLTFSFHFSQFNNLSIFPRKTQVWLNSYLEYIIKIIIKIIGYFWGVTLTIPFTGSTIVVENGLGSCLELFRQNWLWKLKLYKDYITVWLYEIMHHNNMIMITCVMKVKENTSIILLYAKNYS